MSPIVGLMVSSVNIYLFSRLNCCLQLLRGVVDGHLQGEPYIDGLRVRLETQSAQIQLGFSQDTRIAQSLRIQHPQSVHTLLVRPVRSMVYHKLQGRILSTNEHMIPPTFGTDSTPKR